MALKTAGAGEMNKSTGIKPPLKQTVQASSEQMARLNSSVDKAVEQMGVINKTNYDLPAKMDLIIMAMGELSRTIMELHDYFKSDEYFSKLSKAIGN